MQPEMNHMDDLGEGIVDLQAGLSYRYHVVGDGTRCESISMTV